MKIGLVTAAATAALVLTTASFAQAPTPTGQPPRSQPPGAQPAAALPAATTTADYVEQRVDGNQVVTFPGDTLPGDTNSAYGFTIRRPPGVLRAGLIRPRVNFVSELLKSVENL